MIEFLLWAMAVVAAAAILHVAVIWAMPRLVNRRAAGKLIETIGGTNRFGEPSLARAEQRARMINPDLVTSYAVFDLSHGPVRIACAVPPWNSYWSISVYGGAAQNLFTVNDRTAKWKAFTLTIAPERVTRPPEECEEIVISPGQQGLVVVRTVACDRDDPNEIGRIEDVMRRTIFEKIVPKNSRND